MKGLLNRLPKRLVAAVLAVAVLAGVTSGALAGFGPNRPTKAWSPTVEGFDHVTFNSFTGVGNGIGDERDFLRGVQVGRDSVWSDPVANVTQDAEVEAKIYIHNGADKSLNDQPGSPGIARNVTVRVALPTGEKQSHDMTSFISASNAQPGTVFDTLTMTGANGGNFALQYVNGSGKLHNFDGSSSNLSAAQEQALIGGGMALPDIPGCFEFRKEITFRVKVKMPQYNISKQVRFKGQGAADWKDSVSAKPGDSLEWSIKFRNIGKTTLNNVIVLDEVPAGLDVVPGSVRLLTADFPAPGTTAFKTNPIQSNGRTVHLNIGNYRPLTQEEIAKGFVNAQVIFETKVAKPAADKCGDFTLVNKAHIQPEGVGSISDTASVNVKGNVCAPGQPKVTPQELPKTGAGSVAGIFAAVTAAGAAAHNAISRKFRR